MNYLNLAGVAPCILIPLSWGVVWLTGREPLESPDGVDPSDLKSWNAKIILDVAMQLEMAVRPAPPLPKPPRRDYSKYVYINKQEFKINERPEYVVATIKCEYQNFQGQFLLIEGTRGAQALRIDKNASDGLPPCGTSKSFQFDSRGGVWGWKPYAPRNGSAI